MIAIRCLICLGWLSTRSPSECSVLKDAPAEILSGEVVIFIKSLFSSQVSSFQLVPYVRNHRNSPRSPVRADHPNVVGVRPSVRRSTGRALVSAWLVGGLDQPLWSPGRFRGACSAVRPRRQSQRAFDFRASPAIWERLRVPYSQYHPSLSHASCGTSLKLHILSRVCCSTISNLSFILQDRIPKYLEGLTDDELKKEAKLNVDSKNDALSSIVKWLRAFVLRMPCFPNQEDTAKNLEIFRLKMLLRLLEISSFNGKMNALNEVRTKVSCFTDHRGILAFFAVCFVFERSHHECLLRSCFAAEQSHHEHLVPAHSPRKRNRRRGVAHHRAHGQVDRGQSRSSDNSPRLFAPTAIR